MPLSFKPARAAIWREHYALRFDDVLKEPYLMRWVPAEPKRKAFSTACWCYLQSEKTHLLTFGEGLAERCIDPSHLPEYAIRYYRHEVRHSLSTERDLKAVQELCGAAKPSIPFRLLNLAEDARIEAIERQTSHRNFDWLSFEKPVEGTEPEALLLHLIQAEGNAALVWDRLAKALTSADVPQVRAVFDRVSGYYFPLFTAAGSTFSLIPLLCQWVKEFGADKGGSGEAAGDMEQALEAQNNPQMLVQILAGGEEMTGAPTDGASKPPPTKDSSAKNVAGEGNYHFADCREHSLIDLNRASALAEVMKAGFQFGRAKILTNTPARRINFRSVIRHSARIYLHTVQAPAGRRPRVRFYHDCSGSMRGNPRELGLALLAGLNLLAEEGIIDATLTLTMGLDSGRGITACRETFALPAPLAVLETIPRAADANAFSTPCVQPKASWRPAISFCSTRTAISRTTRLTGALGTAAGCSLSACMSAMIALRT